MIAPGLPHHRRHPRIDERRHEPGDFPTIRGIFALLYAVGVVALVLFAFGAVL